ncbi:MAG: HemK2/MTQ2 family protein methyltransferase [Candidatus Altiarchaeota archaeon]
MTFYYRDLVLDADFNVYSPAEDSILLADSIVVDDGERVLDVGTGTGIIALSAAGKAGYVLGVDVDPAAVESARRNAMRNRIINAEFMVSNLFENVSGKFDVVAFNPPYLPSKKVKDKAVDGGGKGRKLIEEFIDKVGEYLNPDGTVFLLVSSLNDVDYVKKSFAEKGFKTESKAEKKLFFETLTVLSAKKKID